MTAVTGVLPYSAIHISVTRPLDDHGDGDRSQWPWNRGTACDVAL